MADKQRDILDLTSLQIKTKPVNGSKRPPSLAVKTWRNKVGVTVFSNVDGLPSKGIFGVNLYPQEFMMFLRDLEKLATEPFVVRKSRTPSRSTTKRVKTRSLKVNWHGGEHQTVSSTFVSSVLMTKCQKFHSHCTHRLN